MKFAFALIEDFRNIGMNPSGFRKSVDETMDMCHDSLVAEFRVYSDSRFVIHTIKTPEYDAMIADKFTEYAQEPLA